MNRSGISKIAAILIVSAVIAVGFGVKWWFENRYLPAKRGEIASTSIFQQVPKTTTSSSRKIGNNGSGVASLSFCNGKTGVVGLNCITDIAGKNRSIAVCDSLIAKVGNELPGAKDYCIGRVALYTGEADSCRAVKNTQLRNECYLSAADSRNNGGICNNIDDFEFREECYIRIAKQTLDLRYCAHIQTRERKDICNSLTLPYKKDPLYLCDNRITEASKNSCYREAAIARQDLSLCGKVSTPLDKYSCVTALAQMRNSREICDTLEDAFLRHNCYDAIESFRR